MKIVSIFGGSKGRIIYLRGDWLEGYEPVLALEIGKKICLINWRGNENTDHTLKNNHSVTPKSIFLILGIFLDPE